jgi:ABC-type multidrug transport system ATPase subunit
MKMTCPECTMDVRWINTWHDPVIEKEAAASLFDGGAQVVFSGADTLIMDEPTAVLAPQEVKDLFGVLHGMVAEGKSIVFISHKLGEVMQIADRITVLRKGRVTAAGPKPADTRPSRRRPAPQSD